MAVYLFRLRKEWDSKTRKYVDGTTLFITERSSPPNPSAHETVVELPSPCFELRKLPGLGGFYGNFWDFKDERIFLRFIAEKAEEFRTLSTSLENLVSSINLEGK